MTDNANGTYSYIISSTTLNNATDYRIQINTTKNISGDLYLSSYEYIVEGIG